MKTERAVRRFFSILALVGAVYSSKTYDPIVVIIAASLIESVLIGIALGVSEAIQESK